MNKKGEQKTKNKTNKTTRPEQFHNSFEKSQKQAIESAHFPGLVHAY